MFWLSGSSSPSTAVLGFGFWVLGFGGLSEYCTKYPSAKFVAGERPWGVACDYAFPCATQNEVEEEGAQALVKGGCKGVFEGATTLFFFFPSFLFSLFFVFPLFSFSLF